MAKPKEPAETPSAAGKPGFGGELARLIAIVGANVILVIVVVVFSSGRESILPNLDHVTFAVGLLPVSAAFGLLLACRRLDLALPMVFVLLSALRTHPLDFFPTDPYAMLAVLCGIGAAAAVASAMVTWIGRISSALWTALLGGGLWWLSQHLGGPAVPGPWSWPAALATSLGVLAAGAVLLGATGLVSLPSMPPIFRAGSKGLVGLVGAWVLAGLAMGLACQSKAVSFLPDQPLTAYTGVLAAGALGGAFILRGRWGAVLAVGLTSLAHLAWFYAWTAPTASPTTHLIIAAGAPLVAVPLYLIIDWLIRRETSESAPTGLMA